MTWQIFVLLVHVISKMVLQLLRPISVKQRQNVLYSQSISQIIFNILLS